MRGRPVLAAAIVWAVLAYAVLGSAVVATAQTLRVATYNLNWGNQRGDQILDAIAAADADVLCFQETTPRGEGYLRHHLSETYPHFYAVGHQGHYLAERFAFASKYPMEDVRFHPPTAGLFGIYTSRVSVGEHRLRLINVHLSPFVVRRGVGAIEAMGAIAQVEEAHGREVEEILRLVNPEEPTVIAGDFNSLADFQAPKRLREQGFIDGFAQVHEDAKTHATWHWPTRPLPLSLRIDYIFHSCHLETTAARVIRREGSDHSLVVLQMRFLEDAESRPEEATPEVEARREVDPATHGDGGP